MKKIIAALLIFSSCTQHEQSDLKKQDAAGEIIKADVDMSKLATEIGFLKALISFADDSAIIIRDGKLPLMSKAEMETEWKDRPLIKNLTWKPIKAQIANSGDLAYSFGFSTYQDKDTTIYSNYCTVWRKQKDNTWKFVFDGGTNIPKPVKYLE